MHSILEKRAKGIIVSILEISKNRNREGIKNMTSFYILHLNYRDLPILNKSY